MAHFFKTLKGLRHGDPLSSLLFNLAVDALSNMLEKEKVQGLIRGVVPHLVQGEGLTDLQYADDTVVIVGCDDESITNMKFILYCFEWMSGLKINYHKSEVTVFVVDKVMQVEISNMLKYKIGSLPIKYLGFPIHDKTLHIKAFEGIVSKMRGKLQPWKGKHLSYGEGWC